MGEAEVKFATKNFPAMFRRVSCLARRGNPILAFLCLAYLPIRSQSLQLPQSSSAAFSLDSVQRVISRRILSEADKKEIRACEREKAQSLQQCRAGDSARAQVDRKLSEAKRIGSDPNDPAIQAQMEKKFSLEKACDDAFNAQTRGKQCRAGEDKRRKALEKALREDKDYQRLLKVSQTDPSEHS